MKSLIGKQAPAHLLATQDPSYILASLTSPLAKTHPLDKLDYGTTGTDSIKFALHRVWKRQALLKRYRADLTKYARDKNVWHLLHLLKRSCSQPSLVKVVKSAKLKWKVPSLKRLVISPLKPKYNPVCPLWAAPCYIFLWSQVPDLVVGLLEGSHCGRQAAHRLQSLTSSNNDLSSIKWITDSAIVQP